MVAAPPYDDKFSLPQVNAEAGPAMDGASGGAAPRKEWVIDDRQLLNICQTELDSSLGWTGTKIAETRRKNLQEYFGNPRGDEREGRSQVVSRDTFEQVEWLLPPLMDIFTSTSQVAVFHPNGQEDAEQAEQITDTTNLVFRQSDGFMALYTMFKDALIQKNGVVKVWWEEDARAVYETYEGKTFPEMQAIQQDPNFEITGLEAYSPETGEMIEPDQLEQLPPEWLLALSWDIEGKRVNNTGRIRIDNIPPEEFIINRDARGLRDPTCRFVGHRVRTSESQLIAWGFDPELVKQLPGAQSVYTTDTDSIIRASQDDSFPLVYSERSDSERTVYINDLYILVDRDGDGVSEWWNVVAAGDYGQVLLSAEPCNSHPFCSVTPIPIPHRFYGLALADVTADLQNIDSTLWRLYLDSLYLSTDPRTVVLSRGEGEASVPLANLDQLLSSQTGGYIEEYAPNAIRPFETRDAAQHVLPALELHKKMKEDRTGVSPEAMGVNPNSISKHVYGAMVQQSAAAQRVTLYARIFADTGVKDIFQQIYKLLSQHQTQPMTVRLRGEWHPVDPTAWATGMDCTVSVGLGYGSKFERGTNIQSIAEAQKALLEGGYINLVSPDNLYNTAVTLAEGLGFKDSNKFFTDPSTVPPPPVEPDPAEMAVQAQSQVEFMRVELERQKLELDRYKEMVNAKKIELQHEEAILKLRIEAKKNEVPIDMPWQMVPGAGTPPAPISPLTGVGPVAGAGPGIPGAPASPAEAAALQQTLGGVTGAPPIA